MATKDKPAGIDFNLDTFQRENVPEPYTFTLRGHRYVCADPSLLDWQTAFSLNAADPREVIRAVIGDDFAEFEKVKLEVWKLEELAKRISKHYQRGMPGDEGEDDAS